MMTYKYDGYNWIVKLKKGEKLLDNLTKLVADEQIKGAWISAIGAVTAAELGYYDLEKQEYQWHEVDETMEVVSLNGNIAWKDDQPALHLHGVFSESDLSSIGGHIKDLTVGGTLEVFIHRWYGDKLTRSQDDEVGLALLDL